ncbi:MAG: phage holin family protein [Oscillospiraceae bacterium]|nr:phage holin family protein [Oscillospiraceae bacterium]
MQLMGLTCVASITAMVYLIACLIRVTPIQNKWLPVICGALGGVLGVVAKFVMPQFPANDIFDAAAIGIASGFAATGVNQAFRAAQRRNAGG